MMAQRRAQAGVFDSMKQHWRQLAAARPGQRFQQRYARRQRAQRSAIATSLRMIGGVLLVVVGLIMLPAPGPGTLIVLLGASLIAQDSRTAARTLDWLELEIRRGTSKALRMWYRAAAPVKAAAIFTAGVSAGIIAWIAHALVFS